jgi:hypothetical protein
VGSASAAGTKTSQFAMADHVHQGVIAAGVSNTGNTAGNTGTRYGSFVFAGSNNVTVSQSTGVGIATLWVSGPTIAAQTNQTGNVYASGNTTGTSSGTYDARTLSIAGDGIVSVAASNSGWRISASQSVQPAVASLNGSSGQLTLVAGNNFSVSNNASTISLINVLSSSAIAQPVSSASAAGTLASRFAAADHAHAGVGAFGATNTGNTAGNTGTSAGTWVLAGTNNVTVSESTGAAGVHTLWINQSGAAGGGIGAIGNTASSNAFTSGTVMFSGLANVTVNTSANGASQYIQLSAPAPGGGAGTTISEFNPYAMNFITNVSLAQNSIYFYPFDLPLPLSAYRLNLFASITYVYSASNNTRSAQHVWQAGLYTKMTDSTDRISQLWSGSVSMGFTGSSHTRLQVTHPAGIANSTLFSSSSTSFITSNATTYLANSVAGQRVIHFPMSLLLTPGRYYLAVANTSASANAQGVLSVSMLVQTHQTNMAYQPFGTSSSASNAALHIPFQGAGTRGAWANSVALTGGGINGMIALTIPFANFSGYTVGTAYL